MNSSKKMLNNESAVSTANLYVNLEALIIISISMENKYRIFSDSKSAIQATKIYNNNPLIVMAVFA